MTTPGAELTQRVTKDIDGWRRHLAKQDWTGAGKILDDALSQCREVLATSGSPKARNAALLCGILVRGLQNSGELAELAAEDGWSDDRSNIERAWVCLCDAQDRIGYASQFMTLEPVKWLISSLTRFEAEFERKLGKGLYMSPEIVIRCERCSVCGKDVRSCEHITNVLYAGVRCVGIPEDIDLRSVSIVEQPKDRRCRIWPWHFTDETHCDVVVATTFRLDDFVEEVATTLPAGTPMSEKLLPMALPSEEDQEGASGTLSA